MTKLDLDRLVSEDRNPNTTDIDLLPALDIVSRINDEDKQVALAVERVLPDIARAVDRIAEAFTAGGRLIYIGAGTSGRLGVLDASECPPTFGVPEGMVVGIIAGGPDALAHAGEAAEDDHDQGAQDLRAISLTAADVVVGITASGRTPYVVGALAYAKSCGAGTIALSCNPESAIAAIAEIAISPVVGPEALTGSTRMKSGTAQKMVLNMLSTASMIRIGKTYGNLMVDLHAANEKLVVRAERTVMQATGCSLQDAQAALKQSENSVKLAILMLLAGLEVDAARAKLASAKGFLRAALDEK